MRAAVYVRVSTTKQENDNQLLQLKQFIASQGWQLATVFADEITGSTSDRAAFKQMMQAASRREFDVVVFWALDRLTREGPLPTLQYLNQLTSWGVKWRSFTEPYIDSCGIFADVVIAVLAAIAKQENVRRSERTRAGLARAVAHGKKLGRRRVAINTEQVHKLRAQGLSWAAIAEQTGLNRMTLQRAIRSRSA